LSFIKLYNSESSSEQLIQLCRIHMNILLAFAQSKTDLISLKFYQLRTMNFLVKVRIFFCSFFFCFVFFFFYCS
jgi:hypothetical protein